MSIVKLTNRPFCSFCKTENETTSHVNGNKNQNQYDQSIFHLSDASSMYFQSIFNF